MSSRKQECKEEMAQMRSIIKTLNAVALKFTNDKKETKETSTTREAEKTTTSAEREPMAQVPQVPQDQKKQQQQQVQPQQPVQQASHPGFLQSAREASEQVSQSNRTGWHH